MPYTIAREGNSVGIAENVLRAEVLLEPRNGYGSFENDCNRLLNSLVELYKKDLVEQCGSVRFTVQRVAVPHAHVGFYGPRGGHSPAILLTAEKSPLYSTEMTDVEWKQIVRRYAETLGEQIRQFRMRISYTVTAEVEMFEHYMN